MSDDVFKSSAFKRDDGRQQSIADAVMAYYVAEAESNADDDKVGPVFDFASIAWDSQRLKDVFKKSDCFNDLPCVEHEALDMIFHKIGRILNGDPNYADSWHDIAGYAQLVERELNA